MKNLPFYNQIAASSAHRNSREFNSDYILKHPECFEDLLAIAFDLKDKNHHKACWILELVLESRLDWLDDYLDVFCQILPLYKQDGAVRSISKICQFLSQKHISKLKSGCVYLRSKHIRVITETCFDWMIGPTKVASKVYAMRALFEIGKIKKTVHPELKDIIEKDFSLHTAAYKIAAKDILKRMK